jgi:Na+/H+-dicarboxylate symporter
MAGMQMVMLAVGIPLEAIGILLLIERPLDTIRTAVNVEGDLVGTLVAKRVAERAAERAAAKSAKRDPVPPRSSSAGAPQ